MIGGGYMGETKVYKVDDFQSAYILNEIKSVMNILEEKGYNPVNQVVGYLMSGDPGYITSYKNARGKIAAFDRSKILEVLLKEVEK